MKIIGPPDYYDFLAGIYGIDNNIVLDRRGGKKIFRREPIVELPQRFVWEQIQVAFCDVMYHGAVRWPHGKETVWGDNVKKLGPVTKVNKFTSDSQRAVRHKEHATGKIKFLKFNPEPTDLNNQHIVPIIFKYSNREWEEYPIGLANYGFTSVMPPDDAYKKLYSWLSERKNEARHDLLTDSEKISAKGFDIKKSFRHR